MAIQSFSSADFSMETVLRELENGYCVALPTETVYGLAADATNGKAVARIFEMKGRPSFNPLICHVDSMEMAREHAQVNETAEKLMKSFWPGPLTIVLPKQQNSSIHPLASAGLDTVGLRCPAGLAQNVIASFGKPLAAPSANRSGRISPTTAQHVAQSLGHKELLILDAGPCSVGVESTIVKTLVDRIVILRPGSVTQEMLEDATGQKVVASDSQSIEAPGMMKSHYAPNAAVELDIVEPDPALPYLGFGDAAGHTAQENTLNLSGKADLTEAAANLYGFLQRLDETGADRIQVAPIPEIGLGVAINDRLRRAASPREDA